jgi:hypothetical protein
MRLFVRALTSLKSATSDEPNRRHIVPDEVSSKIARVMKPDGTLIGDHDAVERLTTDFNYCGK